MEESINQLLHTGLEPEPEETADLVGVTKQGVCKISPNNQINNPLIEE